MSNLPNFLIVGAAKGGTTSLYYYLSQHPDVFFSEVKEPCFFCFAQHKPTYEVGIKTVFDFDQYRKLFENAEGYKVIGEATAIYLYMHDEVIANIKKYIPNYEELKIIVILRNPVDRAYSQYMMNIRDLRDELTFEEAIEAEPTRKMSRNNTDLFYLDRGYYFNQVKAYLDNFKNVKIYLFDELVESPGDLMKDLCVFLQIKDDFTFKMNEKFNVSGRPKFKFISKLIRQDFLIKKLLKRVLPKDKRKRMALSFKNKMHEINLKKEKMNPNTREKLIENFREDILQLQSLIGKDLSNWLR